MSILKMIKKLSPVLEEEILRNIRVLEYETGKKFQSSKPLLVSVRSGAPVSMPGMMDTILNLGFNDYVAEKMLEITKDEKFCIYFLSKICTNVF